MNALVFGYKRKSVGKSQTDGIETKG